MSNWDTSVRRAELAAGGKDTLEFCIHQPHVWHSDAGGGLSLRCIGWAVSSLSAPVRLRLSDPAGVLRWSRPVVSRPDVQQHYARRAIDVDEFTGFDFLLDLQLDPAAKDYALQLEFLVGDQRTEPVPLDVASLYRNHRAALGHDRPYHGAQDGQPGVRGRLDEASGQRVIGWAQNLGALEPVNVVLYLNGERCGEQAADHFREDLMRVGFSESGRLAFEFELPRELEPGDLVSVRAGDGEELKNSPLRVS